MSACLKICISSHYTSCCDDNTSRPTCCSVFAWVPWPITDYSSCRSSGAVLVLVVVVVVIAVVVVVVIAVLVLVAVTEVVGWWMSSWYNIHHQWCYREKHQISYQPHYWTWTIPWWTKQCSDFCSIPKVHYEEKVMEDLQGCTTTHLKRYSTAISKILKTLCWILTDLKRHWLQLFWHTTVLYCSVWLYLCWLSERFHSLHKIL